MPTACTSSTAHRSQQVGFIATGLGAHGLYPSRDGKQLYVANRGSHKIHGSRLGNGGVAVIDFATEKVVARWAVPGGGSPDMGNVSADGKWLWLAARYDDVIYRFDTGQRRRGAGQGRRRAARPDGVAAAGPLFARPHRQPALSQRRGASGVNHLSTPSGAPLRTACTRG